MAKASDNVFPRVIQGLNAADQAAPSDSSWRVYAKAGGIYARSSNAIVGPFAAAAAAGNVATDTIWDAAGDLAVGTGADTAAKLTLGATGKAPVSNGSTLVYAYPPGYEFDYAETTSGGTISATTEATANTIVTANAVAYDGSTVVMIECFLPQLFSSTTVNEDLAVLLFDGSTCIGTLGSIRTQSTNRTVIPVMFRKRITPANASHTYSIRACVPSAHNGGWTAGSGGTPNGFYPAFIRQTKV